MKKRNLVYLTLIIILGVFLIFLVFNKEKSTIKQELRDFAIKDTASIDQIFMVDKQNNKLLLEKKENGWIVNKKFVARQDAINTLLETLYGIEVKYPVPRSAQNNVVKQLSAKSVKVEIYSNNRLIKTIYVGGPTQDQVGTYMLIENSTVPMVVYIPGFNGYLTPRFYVNENQWKAPIIFKYKYTDIYSVTVEHPREPEKSFKAINNGNVYKLIRLSDNSEVSNFDTMAVKLFIGKFKNVNYDIALSQMEKNKRDSIIKTQPLYIFTVEDINHNKRTLKTYLKKNVFTGMKESIPDQPEYDVDNMYGWIPDDSLFVLVQYFVFDNLIRSIDDFIKKEEKNTKTNKIVS